LSAVIEACDNYLRASPATAPKLSLQNELSGRRGNFRG
jgi:hypothetical protein